jgi:glycogen debranching enzyme
LFDEYAFKSGGETTLGWIPPIASVPLNSFLYKDALTLARLSRLAGEDGYANGCEKYAESLCQRLFEICFVPEEKRFWDYNHTTGRHTRIKTFYMFWPIWAGMPVRDEVKRDLIENVLLSPDHFFGDIPFPSVAYSEPSYNPRGYWRGRTWPHISYWLIQMLWREGYRKEADTAAERILCAFLRESSLPENLASQSGLIEAAGHAHYNWGMASAYLLGTKHYRL